MYKIYQVFATYRKRREDTCAESEAGLFAHVAQADGDAVSSTGLQAFQQVLHCVVLGCQLVVPLQLTDSVPHVDRIRLQVHKKTYSYSFPIWIKCPCQHTKNIGFNLHPVPSL